jgi:CubicO group peptidase (beta-lactamase class C family)
MKTTSPFSSRTGGVPKLRRPGARTFLHDCLQPTRWMLIALLAMAASSAAAAPAATPKSPGNSKSAAVLPPDFDVTAIDRYIGAWVAEKGLVGLSVSIVRDGRVVLAKGYGLADQADGTPVTNDTRFAIGSVSKQFTCVAALLLAEEGRLAVTDKVSRFFPGLTRAADITLLDLMNHTSGYPDYYPLDYVDRRMRETIDPDELLRRYAGGKLDFEPGSNFSYSNTGYILLGRIIEKVAGEPLGTFLDRRLFRPIGMTNTVYEPAPGLPRSAKGYTGFALSAPEPVAPEASGWLGGAGGIWSTPGDLARWNLALFGGSVLKPASRQILTAPRTLSSGRISPYGCGLGTRTQGGRAVLSHSGAVSGFNTWNAVVPSTRSSVTMTCNLDGGLGGLPPQVFALLLKEAPTVPAIRAAPAAEVSRTLFVALQSGAVDRSRFSPDFNEYLTPARLEGASSRLKALGKPSKVELLSTEERGGMEVSVARVTCPRATLRTLMYRRPDGTVEQFFVNRE